MINNIIAYRPFARLLAAVLLSSASAHAFALGNNIAPQAKATVSSATDA